MWDGVHRADRIRGRRTGQLKAKSSDNEHNNKYLKPDHEYIILLLLLGTRLLVLLSPQQVLGGSAERQVSQF
jgi:hypothetical protein